MNTKEIEKKVIGVINKYTSEKSVSIDDNLKDDLSLTSMDLLILISNLESVFNIKIKENKIMSCDTILDICDYINSLLN